MRIEGVQYGEVLSVDDQHGADMITVKIHPEDNSKSEANSTLRAFPLLPKMLHIKPKVGEGVLVLFAVWNDGNSQRYYIGPVISQAHRMEYDPWFGGADSYQVGSYKGWDENPLNDENSFGAYSKDDDISIVGRKNCDIQIKEDDIRIRAGVKLVDEKYKVFYNREHPAFIKLKYHENPIFQTYTDSEGEDTILEPIHSTATIVADRINLLGNSRSGKVSLEDDSAEARDELITDKKLENIISKAYSLPYGEILVDLLQNMIDIFCNHTHDFSGKVPNRKFIDAIRAAANEPLDQRKLLSDTVKIN